jgi:hypothetical protein
MSRWLHWCADTRTDPVRARPTDLADFVLDELGRGASEADVASGLEAAGALTGLWCTSEYATLRLGLDAPGEDFGSRKRPTGA